MTLTNSDQPQPPKTHNLRKHRRVPFAFEVEVTGPRAGFVGQCQRITDSGLHVYTSTPFAPGDEVDLHFTLPEDSNPIKAKGKVLRSAHENHIKGTFGGISVLFTEVNRADQSKIRDFVMRCILRSKVYQAQEQYTTDCEPQCESEEEGIPTIPVRFFGTGQALDEYVVNISEGGVFVRSLNPLPLNTKVSLDLYLPGGDTVHRIDGRVVWSRPPSSDGFSNSGMGIQFKQIKEKAAKALRNFVETFGKDEE